MLWLADLLESQPPTGEPSARNWPARFGGRGDLIRRPYPYHDATRSRGSVTLRAPESAHQQWGGSPHRTEHWLSVVEGNCVVERRGGRQPETNCQSINKTM